jgi:hypothetical protein
VKMRTSSTTQSRGRRPMGVGANAERKRSDLPRSDDRFARLEIVAVALAV